MHPDLTEASPVAPVRSMTETCCDLIQGDLSANGPPVDEPLYLGTPPLSITHVWILTLDSLLFCFTAHISSGPKYVARSSNISARGEDRGGRHLFQPRTANNVIHPGGHLPWSLLGSWRSRYHLTLDKSSKHLHRIRCRLRRLRELHAHRSRN